MEFLKEFSTLNDVTLSTIQREKFKTNLEKLEENLLLVAEKERKHRDRNENPLIPIKKLISDHRNIIDEVKKHDFSIDYS